MAEYPEPIKRILPSRFLCGLAAVLESRGVDANGIAGSVGLDPRVLTEGNLPITDHQLNDMIEAAALACDDPFFLLKLAQVQGWDVLGSFDAIFGGVSTIGDALRALVQYNEAHNPALYFYLKEESGLVTLYFEVRAFGVWDPMLQSGQLQMVDLVMAVFCLELRRLLGPGWVPQYVMFRYAAPDSLASMQQVFGEHLHFDQECNALCLSAQDCERPFNRAALHGASSESLAPEDDDQIAIPVILRVDRAIRVLINNGRCSASGVAEMLNMNLRTLQHQLKQQGASYQSLYDTVRLDLARYYLGTSELSISAIAERLAFTDSAAFSNFFKSRAGLSPSEYSQRLNR